MSINKVVVVALCALMCLTKAWAAEPRTRILFDTDANNEMDDQYAIAYMLLNSGSFDAEGITVNATAGGGPIEQHFAEAERVVALCAQASHVAVYKGANNNYAEIVSQIGQPIYDGSEAVDFIIERALAPDTRRLVLMAVGKLTNIALALKKEPAIADKVRIVWLGTNYPSPGEYNFDHDIEALDVIIETGAQLEIATVRYRKPSGTDAVRVSLEDVQRILPGKGPKVFPPIVGRHGGSFSHFGDYAINLFENMRGGKLERPLFDMAAVAIVKNPMWADHVVIAAPRFIDGVWVERPNNPRKIVIWENFDKDAIVSDFFTSMVGGAPLQP